MIRVLRRCLALAILPAVAAADGLQPRKAAEEYAAHRPAGPRVVAAEFQYRTAVRERQSFTLRKGLVVEVAVFGPAGGTVELSAGHFSLRINGKGRALLPEPAGIAMSRDRWGSNPALLAGYNDYNVLLGGPEPGRRFPGDPRSQEPPGRIPKVDNPVEPPAAEVDPAELLAAAALPEGKRDLPAAGLLYFHYPGKVRKIRKLELFYQGPGGETAVLQLK